MALCLALLPARVEVGYIDPAFHEHRGSLAKGGGLHRRADPPLHPSLRRHVYERAEDARLHAEKGFQGDLRRRTEGCGIYREQGLRIPWPRPHRWKVHGPGPAELEAILHGIPRHRSPEAEA